MSKKHELIEGKIIMYSLRNDQQIKDLAFSAKVQETESEAFYSHQKVMRM